MSTRPSAAAPVEGLTYQAFWNRFVRIVEPATGKIIKPTPTAKQGAFIAAVDSGQYHEYFRHQSKKTSKSFDAATWIATTSSPTRTTAASAWPALRAGT